MKALASHQCGPGSNPGVDTMCGLSLLLVLSPCAERFFSGCSGIPLSTKTSISKFQFNQESGRRRTSMWMCYLQIVIYLFILFIIYLIVVLLLLLFFCFYFNFNEVLPNMGRERKRKTVRWIMEAIILVIGNSCWTDAYKLNTVLLSKGSVSVNETKWQY